MNECYEKERKISLVDLFALYIRKIVVIAFCAFFCAALAVGFHISKVNRSFNPSGVEQALTAKRAELDNQKAVKALEYELTLGPYLGSLTTADYEKVINLFSSLDRSISSLEGEVATLENGAKTGRMPYSISKYAVLGFLAGGFVALMIISVGFVVSNPVTGSADVKANLKIPFLGAVFSENGCFKRLSRKVMGEACWKDRTTALKWFEENLDSTVLPDKTKVAVLYSGNNKKAIEAGKDILAVLKKKGYEASFTENAALNPETNSTVQGSDVVLLFEMQWISKWNKVCICKEIAQRFEKKVAGFVLC